MNSIKSLGLLSFVVIFYSVAGLASPEIIEVNGKVLRDIDSLAGRQGGDVGVKVKEAWGELKPTLDVKNLNLVSEILDYVERNRNSSMSFVILSSLGEIGALEDTRSFERLLDIFDSKETSSQNRTSVSNSIRAAGVRSGNQGFLSILEKRVRGTADMAILAEYIFFLGREANLLASSTWFFPFLLENLTNPNSEAVRKASASELGQVVWQHGEAIVRPDDLVEIKRRLFSALQSETDLEVRLGIIRAMEMDPDNLFRLKLISLKLGDPEPEIRKAAERALFAYRGGFENSNYIAPGQQLMNVIARLIGGFDRFRGVRGSKVSGKIFCSAFTL